MNIQQIKRIIRRYLTGKASEQEQLLVDKWLQAKERSVREPDKAESERREKIVFTQLQTYIRTAGHPSSGDGETAAADETSSFIGVTAGTLRRMYWRRWMAAASVILLAGAFAAWVYRYQLLDTFAPLPVRELAAASFSVREVLLPDSSVVVLNSGSTIRFPDRFRGNKREIVLTGQAFFKVRSRPQQSFIVKADSLQVRVLGTSFIVSNVHSARLATVGVTSGKVAVRYDREGFPETTLTPGRELQYDKSNTKITVVGNAPISTDWTAKRLIFTATPLPDVFHAIEQSYGKTIRYEASSLHDKAFTGSFDRKDALPEVLKVLSLSYGLAIQQNKDGSLMIR